MQFKRCFPLLRVKFLTWITKWMFFPTAPYKSLNDQLSEINFIIIGWKTKDEENKPCRKISMKDYWLENINITSLFSICFPKETKVQTTWVIPVRLMQKSESLGLISGFTYCWKVSSCNKGIKHSAAAHYVATSLARLQLKGNSNYSPCGR